MLALTFASAVSVALVVARVVWTDNFRGAFLIWNLFLAWLPLIFALLACEQYRNGVKARLALPRFCRRVAAVLSERALHFHRSDPSVHRLVHGISGWT